MATFEIQVKNGKEIARALERYPAVATPILERTIDAVLATLAKNTLKGDPIPWRTGRLLQSFAQQRTGLVGRWFPTAFYAPYVHGGTGPHIITARPGKFLFWPGAAHPVRSVRHPGSKANPFMPKILEKSLPAIDKLFVRSGELILERIAKA